MIPSKIPAGYLDDFFSDDKINYSAGQEDDGDEIDTVSGEISKEEYLKITTYLVEKARRRLHEVKDIPIDEEQYFANSFDFIDGCSAENYFKMFGYIKENYEIKSPWFTQLLNEKIRLSDALYHNLEVLKLGKEEGYRYFLSDNLPEAIPAEDIEAIEKENIDEQNARKKIIDDIAKELYL